MALLSWHLLLTWFIIWPGDLSTPKEKAMVAFGGPVIYMAVHFMLYAYAVLWYRAGPIPSSRYRRKFVISGLAIYLATHLSIVIAIALKPRAFFWTFVEHFHGDTGPVSDVVALVIFCCLFLGTIVVVMSAPEE
jgi:hypothetical protein